MANDALDGLLPLRNVEVEVLVSVHSEPRHGYAVLQEAEQRRGGHPGFEIPTLYRALRRLREAGLIEAVDPPPDERDQRREYWIASDLGRRALAAEVRRMESIVRAVRSAGPGEVS